MSKRKARSQRKRTPRPAQRPPAAPAAAPPEPAEQPVPAPAPAPRAPVAVAMPPGRVDRPREREAPERSVTRMSTRDYTYVRREIRRIVILAIAIIVTIIILSFFLP